MNQGKINIRERIVLRIGSFFEREAAQGRPRSKNKSAAAAAAAN